MFTPCSVREALLATLRGCGQLAFCSTARSGAMVLAGIALLAPACALGVALGAVVGTAAGRSLGYAEDEWRAGLAGFNPALVGLVWGGLVGSADPHWLLLTLALVASTALDAIVRRAAARLRMPALTMAALITLVCVGIGAAATGGWFLLEPNPTPVLPFGAAGAGLIGLAMTIESRFAAAWAFLLAMAAALGVFITGQDLEASLGLWAISVPLAAYGVAGVFLRDSLAGAVAAAIAAATAAVTWIAWQASGLADLLPPLVAPFIVGTWIGIAVVHTLAARPELQSTFLRLARRVAHAQACGRPVIVSIPPDSGFVEHNAALGPIGPASALGSMHPSAAVTAMGVSAHNHGATTHAPGLAGPDTVEPATLLASPRARAALWEAIARARDLAEAESSRDLPDTLVKLIASGVVTAVIRPAAMAGDAQRDTIALRGRLDRTECLGCGIHSHWPPLALWRRMDLRCPACGGAVVPDRAALGLTLAPEITERLDAAGARQALVLVGTAPPDDTLLQRALERLRAAGATLVFVGRVRHPAARPGDLRVPESLLSTLERLYRLRVIIRLIGMRRSHRAHNHVVARRRAAPYDRE